MKKDTVTLELGGADALSLVALRRPLAATSDAEVVQKALAMAEFMVGQADAAGVLTVVAPDGSRRQIILGR
jgi:hypothetical protein